MAKTRLSSYIKARLIDLAKEIITVPTEQAACDKAYAPAVKLVHTAIVSRFPQNDMEILKRYDCACVPPYVYLTRGEDSRPYVEFIFRKSGDAPLSRTHGTKTFITDDKTIKAATAYNDAVKARAAAFDAKMKDYSALVHGVGSLEDIEVVWPEATRIREKLIGGAVSTLNPEVIERIRADVAGRKRKR